MKKIGVLLLFVVSTFCIHGYNKLHVQMLQNVISNKKVINASRCDFRGTGTLLKGLNFSNGQLSGAIFSTPTKTSKVGGIVSIPNQKSDLTSSNFSSCSLISTDFSGAILKNANFTGADLSYANFAGADLTGAIFIGVQNADLATFCGAIMPDGSVCNGTSWTDRSAKITMYCNCPKKQQQ